VALQPSAEINLMRLQRPCAPQRFAHGYATFGRWQWQVNDIS